MAHHAKKPPSQRQLQVGEEIRQVVASIFLRNETHDPVLDRESITVSEVRISPDLKNATCYVTPLAGGAEPDQTIRRLNESAASIRKTMGKHLVLRYTPKLMFKLDRSFEEAGKINRLLQNPKVRDDLDKDSLE
jgi:ribosome-binding factor A